MKSFVSALVDEFHENGFAQKVDDSTLCPVSVEEGETPVEVRLEAEYDENDDIVAIHVFSDGDEVADVEFGDTVVEELIPVLSRLLG